MCERTLASTESLQGLLVTESDLTGAHHQLEARVDVFHRFLLLDTTALGTGLAHNDNERIAWTTCAACVSKLQKRRALSSSSNSIDAEHNGRERVADLSIPFGRDQLSH